jgi:hypothetical protein
MLLSRRGATLLSANQIGLSDYALKAAIVRLATQEIPFI